MIWTNEIGVFFFVGYVLAKYTSFTSLSVAVIAAAVAITMFFAEKRSIDLKKSLTGKKGSKGEEDFF
ncbi:hypothetical protein SDC9_195500 [bioreactor metagenome]|uniref:Uncharacterized protein n=1 Tax=bioreactor metagenome TaxID=1076179 RepID=A0A645IAF9_9ZZZZ